MQEEGFLPIAQPSGHYLPLIFQVGSSEIMARSPRAIKTSGLGRLVTGSETQIVFLSISSVAGSDEGVDRKRQKINIWFWAWCHLQDFGFFNGLIYRMWHLLQMDELHLSHRPVQELARLIERALKGKGTKLGFLEIILSEAYWCLKDGVLERSISLHICGVR